MPFDWLKSLKQDLTLSSLLYRRRYPRRPHSSDFTLESRTLLSAAPIGPEFKVNTYTTSRQSFPEIAVDADGDFVIVWSSLNQDGNNFGIYAQRYNAAGVPQGAEFRVNSYTTNLQREPAVAMDANGDFVVTWSSYTQDGSGDGIYAQRFNALATPQGTEFKVNSYTSNQQSYPDIAMDQNGNFVIAWTSDLKDGSSQGIYAQRFNAAGAPLGSEFQVNSFTTDFQESPSVAMDWDGDFVIAWQSVGQDSSGSGIYAQRFNAAGTPQGSEFKVNSYTTGNQINPDVAIDAFGDFVIDWTSQNQDGSNYGIYAKRYDLTGIPLGDEFRVNTVTTGDQSHASVSMDADGNFVITWASNNDGGVDYEVFAQFYRAAGTTWGTERKINSSTQNSQFSPAVAMDSDGDSIIVWSSDLQDGSLYGIYAQRYRASHAAYVGAWRTGSFFLDSNHNDNYDGSIDDSLFSFGSTTDKPLVGDWNGDGYDDIGVWRAGTFYLDANGNGLWDGSVIDRTFPFGLSTDTPVIGDWNRDGKDEVGVWRAGKFYLDLNGNRILDAAPTDAVFSFGAATDTPIVGDWNGDGTYDIGVWRAGRFFLDLNGNRRWDRPVNPGDDTVFFFGIATDKPVVGDWNSDGIDDIGVWRAGQFWIDLNGNRSWDGPENEYIIDFGNTTDTPLIGYWRPKTVPGSPPPAPSLLPGASLTPTASGSANPSTLASLMASPRKRTIS